MDHCLSTNDRFLAIAWGAIFLLVGSLNLIPGDQTGIAILGIGLIFILLNLARYLRKIPVNGFSISLGVAGALLGTLALLPPALGLEIPVELSLFAFLIIAIGLYLLVPNRQQAEAE